MSEKQQTQEESALREKHKNVIRLVSIVVFIFALAGITYLLYPLVKSWVNYASDPDGGADKLREEFSRHGSINSLLIFLGIQALQVVVAVVPAIQAVGGVLYGWLFGAVLSFAGIVLGALAVWGIVKKLGKPLVEATVGEKHLKRFKFLEDEHKLTIILIILFIIPGVPKDVVTYIVPLTKIKMRDFFLMVLPFRIPSIILTTALGDNLTTGNYAGAIIISAVILVIAVLGLIFKDKILDHFNRLHSARKRGGKQAAGK
ncbi:MAG: VTT domain-containing protein [Ruminococcus sp.]|nr:VTT domain-containing protein [Ruminococcus sp.]